VDVLDRGEIDDQAAVTDSQPAGIVAPAPDGNVKILFSGELNGGHDVRRVRAPGDQARSAADHGVIDLAGFLVARVRGFDQITPETSPELSDGFLLHRFL
jgi:hypothetical protein